MEGRNQKERGEEGMKSTGMVRKIDNLGRLVLPKETRDIMNLPEGTPMEFFIDGDSIILRKFQTGCTFCGSLDGLKEFGGQYVCEHCREVLRNKGV